MWCMHRQPRWTEIRISVDVIRSPNMMINANPGLISSTISTCLCLFENSFILGFFKPTMESMNFESIQHLEMDHYSKNGTIYVPKMKNRDLSTKKTHKIFQMNNYDIQFNFIEIEIGINEGADCEKKITTNELNNNLNSISLTNLRNITLW